MHFWIDKRSQGCGYSGRYHIPPSISGYGRNQRNLCSSYYPKPMVTPVRRFQSIESVANNGLRYTRSPGYHSRPHQQCSSPTVHYNGSNGNIRIPQMERTFEPITRQNSNLGQANNISTTTKLKCGAVTLFFVVVTFFLALAKYFYNGFPISLNLELIVFCVMLFIVLVIGGVIAVCEADAMGCSPSHSPVIVGEPSSNVPVEQHTDIDETRNSEIQTSLSSQNSSELPPPPYHIAVMLSPQNNLDTIQIIRDSPPPSYEKAVT